MVVVTPTTVTDCLSRHVQLNEMNELFLASVYSVFTALSTSQHKSMSNPMPVQSLNDRFLFIKGFQHIQPTKTVWTFVVIASLRVTKTGKGTNDFRVQVLP